MLEIVHIIGNIKMVVIVLCALTGFAFAEVYAFFAMQESATLSGSVVPGIIGMVGAVLVIVVGKLFDRWNESRKDTANKKREIEAQHQTFSEKIAELQEKRTTDFIDELKEFGETKIRFKNEQILSCKVSEFYARERAHAFATYATALQSYAQMLEIGLKAKGAAPTYEFTFKSQNEIMDGIEDRVLAYEQKLKEEAKASQKERDARDSLL